MVFFPKLLSESARLRHLTPSQIRKLGAVIDKKMAKQEAQGEVDRIRAEALAAVRGEDIDNGADNASTAATAGGSLRRTKGARPAAPAVRSGGAGRGRGSGRGVAKAQQWPVATRKANKAAPALAEDPAAVPRQGPAPPGPPQAAGSSLRKVGTADLAQRESVASNACVGGCVRISV